MSKGSLLLKASSRAILFMLSLMVFASIASYTSAYTIGSTFGAALVESANDGDGKNGQPAVSESLANFPVGGVGTIYWYRRSPFPSGVTEYCVAVTNGEYAQLSFSPVSGFSSMLINVPFSSDNSGDMGFGSTPILYVKGIAPINNLAISLSCPVTVNDAAYINVVPAPPTPTPTPTSSPRIPRAYLVMNGATSIGVGEFITGHVEVEDSRINYIATATISVGEGTTPTNLAVAKQPLQAPTNSITMPVSLDSHGNGRSSDFLIYGKEAKLTPHTIKADIHYGNGIFNLSRSLNVLNLTQLTVYRDFGQVPLDTNPNTGAGLRVFPEKKTPTDESNGRKRVLIKAKLSRPIAGIRVEFKLYDVDDPFGEVYTADDPTRSYDIDPNGDLGDDNRDKVSMNLGTVYAVTDTSGEAVISAKVPLQPGDNFRAVATARPNPEIGGSWFLNFVRVDDTNLSFGGSQLTELGDAAAIGLVTPMVTTWRSLHIERDSLGVVTGNSLSRQISSKRNLANGNTEITIAGTGLEADALTRGRVSIPSLVQDNSFDIVANDRFTIEVSGQTVPAAAIGRTATIYDDDDADRNDIILIGDNGDDVPMPDTGFLQETDIPTKNLLTHAYIRPKYDLGTGSYDDDLPFVLNTPKAVQTRDYPTDEEAMSMMEFDNVSLRRNDEFWTIYLFGAYQGPLNQDFDPDDDAQTAGVQGFLGYFSPKAGALCFIENISDQANHSVWNGSDRGFDPYFDPRSTPLHEVAHTLRAEHADGGLMDVNLPGNPFFFTGKSLSRMRSSSVPKMADY